MKKLSTALQTVAALAIIIAAIPVTINQWDLHCDRASTEDRAHKHGSLAAIAAKADDPALAAQAYGDALALDPHNTTWRAGLLEAHITGVLNDASVISSDPLRLHAELADAVTSTAPSARLLVAFGRVLQYRGQKEQAGARFEQALKQNPKFADAHLYLGDLALKAGKLDEASVHLSEALKLSPKLMVAKFALGQVRLKQKRTDDAIKLLKEAAGTIANGNVYLALGKALVIKEQWIEAEAALERALALSPKIAGAHRPLADAYLHNKKIEAAMGAFRMAWQQSGDVDAYRRLGRLLSRTEQHKGALQVFGELRSLFPDDVEAHCQIGSNGLAIRRLEIAKPAFETCVKLAGDKKEFVEMIKVARKELESIDKAIADMRAKEAAKNQKKSK